jgi:hypothetical protein
LSYPRRKAMERRPCEADKLLAWLGEVLRQAEGVDVDVVVTDGDNSVSSSVQITLHRVPGPLAGLPVSPRAGA